MQPIRFLTFCACLSAAGLVHAQADVRTIPSGDWSRAMGPLRDAIECNTPLKATAAVRNVLRPPQGNLTADYTLPEPLTVFGSLKVTAVSIYDEGAEGASFTIKPAGVKLADIARAARLKKDNGRYFRAVKGGHIEAGEPRKGEFALSCVSGEYGD